MTKISLQMNFPSAIRSMMKENHYKTLGKIIKRTRLDEKHISMNNDTPIYPMFYDARRKKKMKKSKGSSSIGQKSSAECLVVCNTKPHSFLVGTYFSSRIPLISLLKFVSSGTSGYFPFSPQ
jgi:hypothetical protein